MAGDFLDPSHYITRTGNYIHVGKMVWIQINIKISSKNSLTNNNNNNSYIKIILPIQCKTDLKQGLYVSNIIDPNTNIYWIEGEIPSGSSIDYFNLPFKDTNQTNSTYLSGGDLSNTTEIIIAGYYFTN